jgi:hypothetical protein
VVEVHKWMMMGGSKEKRAQSCDMLPALKLLNQKSFKLKLYYGNSSLSRQGYYIIKVLS